ncbi:cystatin-like cysteine protease inhibitor domain-containing protein [Trypanosoma grayi]|uniref:cystatin-like cysteine protease inhibitor domain-containing protein n=1 Tax=Trypanosoma grayi TaxID=71804 RepID=UPI0004F3F680|nr:cystatin-like cysteine protease inhibitor domain-containing protein [Trypanosoma grayi]KEG11818.1 cystatin-like cysteine protease inhibitor domain-containing protein [Trypanosoma grayi]
MNNAWTPFIYYTFGDSNIHVGLMSALNGLFELIFALLGGHLADRVLGPSRTLQLSVRFGIFALCFTLCSVWSGNWWMLIIAQSLYGTYMGLSFTSVESVFAQCLQQGDRDRMYGVKFSLEAAGPIAGLGLSLVLFAFFGNTWRLEVLRWVIAAGLVLHIVSMEGFLARFKPLPSHLDRSPSNDQAAANLSSPVSPYNQEEQRALYVEEEIAVCTDSSAVIAPTTSSPLPQLIPLPPPPPPPESTRETGLCTNFTSDCGENEKPTKKKRWILKDPCSIPLEYYPYVVALADVVTTLGSGMTTQYFSLFMMKIYFISPIGMALLGIVTAILISALAIINASIGRRIGRTRALMFPKLSATFILLYMALARGTTAAPTWMMCIAYVARMSLINSTMGLSRALIMDIVSEERRGMWNAVESIQSASWSGTAVVGGYLADRLGYGAAFIFTFGFHLTACFMIAPCTMKNDTKLSLFAKGNGAQLEQKDSFLPSSSLSDQKVFVVKEVTVLDIAVAEEEMELGNHEREPVTPPSSAAPLRAQS